ncbi:MAG: YggS family pyridoxal phosphate-dependent enzyme [Clostridiaceae bacterium]|mgnify:CR=1 FL=1|nr:YggS family pyridoxal phosphate-dependent enzyme [Clostridiaceae bacterium]
MSNSVDVEKMRESILKIRKKIEAAAEKSGRNPDDILLLGVTKTVDVDAMQAAFDLGIKDFGENRVQEFVKKSDIINRECRWHIIGRLQTNKVKYLDNRISLIHSLDRLKLAEALDKRGKIIDYVFPVLVQVNVSGESTKAGIEPENLKNFLLQISKMGNIKVKGLMTIAPYTEDSEAVRYVFRNLKQLAVDIDRERLENISMEELSMGMSGDYETAIEEGSTIVRIGSAIFGERIY